MMNDVGFMHNLEQPQVFNFEIIIDRVRIIKGDQRNYIPADESDKATKPPSFHGSIKKRKRKRKRGKKKGKRKKSGNSKKGSRSSSKKGSKKSSKKGSKKSSKKSSAKSSKKGSPKGKRSPKGKKSKRKSKASSKGKKKRKSKGGKKGKGKKDGSKLKKKQPKQDALPGNRREIPPFRIGIDVLGFHDIYIHQIDVDPVQEEEFISTGDSPYTPGTGTDTTTGSSEYGPVDPLKLAKALEEAQKDKEKIIDKGRKKSRRGSKKKSKSGSSSGTKRGSKKGKGSSTKSSKKGSPKKSKKGSPKKSKKGSPKKSKKGSPKKSKKGSPKGKKKKSGKGTPKKKKIADTSSSAGTEPADTWSVASETTIKRGRALMLSEIPKKIISQFQGCPIKIRVERYGGKHHNNGEVIPVGTVTIPFPPDWSEAVLEVQREINPRTYDASAFPVVRGIEGRYSIKANNEHIGDIKLEMNLYCFANTAVSKLFPTDATLYDALLDSENISKCCDAMTNKKVGMQNIGKPNAYYGYKPGEPNPYEYAWKYAMSLKETNNEKSLESREYGISPGGTYNRMTEENSRGVAEYSRKPENYTGIVQEEVYGGLTGDNYDVYSKAKKMNYTARFNL